MCRYVRSSATARKRSASLVETKNDGVANRRRPLRQTQILDLARSCLATQLLYDLHHLSPAVELTFRQMTAAGIARQFATQFYAPALHPVGRRARRAETKPLQHKQQLRRESIVNMQCAYVLRTYARHAIYELILPTPLLIEDTRLIYAQTRQAEYELVGPRVQSLNAAFSPLHAGEASLLLGDLQSGGIR